MNSTDLVNPIKIARDQVQGDIDVLIASLGEAETVKKEYLSSINQEMENFLKMVYAEFAEKRNAVETKFSEDTMAIRNSIAENRKRLFGYERAIESLSKIDGSAEESAAVRNNPSRPVDDSDVPSETIYDAVIHLLYNNLSSGLTYNNIAEILVARGFIPSHKNPVNVCANVLGILKNKGYIDKVNDHYMLTDKQEADYRRGLSRTVFGILSNDFGTKTATLRDVVTCLRGKVDKRRLPDDLNRRVRGILIGLKLQGYVSKNYGGDGQECFAVAPKNAPKPIEQEIEHQGYSP